MSLPSLSVRAGQCQSPQCSCDEDLGKTVAGRVCHLMRERPVGGDFTRSRQHISLYQHNCWNFS